MDGNRIKRALGLLKDGTGHAYPGCQIWVAHRNEVILHEAMGMANAVSEKKQVDLDTQFDLASLTKALCTTLIAMRLYSEGELDLNRTVDRDLGHFPCPQFLSQATYADLLRHSSGLQGYEPLFQRFNPRNLPLPAQARIALAKKIAELDMAYEPGTTSVYSDFGFLYLGWALERITGTPLAALFHAHVLNPLGLTQLRPAEANVVGSVAATEHCSWRNDLVDGEVHDEHAFVLGGLAGHAGLFGTARAVGRVAQNLLDAYHGRNTSYLPQNTVQKFWSPSNSVGGSTWRLGFDGASGEESLAGNQASSLTVGHLGFTGTSLWIYPKHETVIVLLTNRVHPNRNNESIREIRRAFHSELLAGIIDAQPSFL